MSKLSDGIKSATEGAKSGLASAREKTAQTGAAARQAASDTYGRSREAAARGVQSSKDMAHKAAAKTGDTVDKNPIAIVLGGLALGAIAGALLPTTAREKKVLGKAGKKLNQKASDVANAAKTAGKDKVESLGLNGDAVRDQFRDLVSKAAEAVKAAGQAAGVEARKK